MSKDKSLREILDILYLNGHSRKYISRNSFIPKELIDQAQANILKLAPSKDKISIEIFDTTYYVLSEKDTEIVDKTHALIIKKIKGE